MSLTFPPEQYPEDPADTFFRNPATGDKGIYALAAGLLYDYVNQADRHGYRSTAG